jgi:addiction module HigA family antidote
MMEKPMYPKNRLPTHPGEVLLEEFLIPMNISQVTLARHLRIPIQRVNEIVRGKRGITPETAWLLAQAFGNTPEFWMNLQVVYDLVRSRPKYKIAALIAV